MAIHVIIKRKVKQGHQSKELVPLLLQMRSLAMYKPGYISGETLCDIEHPGECLVISTWEIIEDWPLSTWMVLPPLLRSVDELKKANSP